MECLSVITQEKLETLSGILQEALQIDNQNIAGK
jgi:hypothetical protein